MKKLKDTKKMNEWISVKDRLPDIEERVLVYMEDLKDRDYFIQVGYIDNKNKFNIGYRDEYSPEEVSHWMNLPEPPK